ncbi:MAG: hypothetical protein H0W47_10120 [Polaromonas sp.]|nr:hypothetical protein [Polaromonas sp.]
MDAITTSTSNSRLIPAFTPSQEVSPSAAAPPNSGMANGIVQQATQAPANPRVANTGFFILSSPHKSCGLIPVKQL